MDIVKKNIVSIICGVVALAAVVAVFVWPLPGYYDQLNAEATKRAQRQQVIQRLLNQTRTVPNPNPNNPGAEQPLVQFPSAEVIAAGANARSGIEQQAKAIYFQAVKLNKKASKSEDLAVPGSLPKPFSDTLSLKFHELLSEQLKNLRTKVLGAGMPPTTIEIETEKEALWNELKKSITYVGDQPTNLPAVMDRFNREAAKIPEQMQKRYADAIKIYVDPTQVMTVPASIPPDKAPATADMWWAQVEFWVAQDVVDTINVLNAKAKSVEASPVKALRALRVPPTFFPDAVATAAAATAGRGDDAAAEANPEGGAGPDPAVPLPDGSAQSPTKRVSNPLFDVVQFELTVDIEADQVARFLKHLATNRFVTVLNMEMVNVDTQAMQAARFVYGNRAVVTLTLKCEALFLRHWTIKYMPDSVRKIVGAPKQWAEPELDPTKVKKATEEN